MSIPLTGNGGLMTRIGLFFGRILDTVALQGGTATARVLSGASMTTNFPTIAVQYDDSPALPNVFNGAYTDLASFQSSYLGFVSACVQRCQNTVIQMANTDTPLAQQTLSAALTLLASQMKANAQSINASTVTIGAQTASGSPNGNPTLAVTADRPDGLIWQNVYPETLTFTVTNDSQAGSTLNQEPISVTGQAANSAVWSYNWPGGSGANASLSMTDPTASNSGGNALTNSTWATFTNTDYPDNWVYLVGTATTSFAKATSPVYFGSNSLKMISDGTNDLSVAQTFNTATSTGGGSGGTPYKLLPSTQYAAVVYYQLSAASPVAGVLEMSLVDGTNTTVNDGAGNANAVTANLHNIADTNWHALTGFFRTPALLPSQLKLRVRQSTAVTAGTNIYLGGVALTPAISLYTGGPSAAAFAGNTKVLKGDAWTFSVTNTPGLFAQTLQRAFNMTSLGIQLPYSGSPTVADSLIT